jgi:energy-coupling factor transport system ATP-binding protein
VGLQLRGIDLSYLPGTPIERQVLHGIDIELRSGEIACLMGRTGAGKSSLLLVMCGMSAGSGEVELDGRKIDPRSRGQALREAVGILMQSSERQLFAETVEKDVAFGPKNQGLPSEEARARARQSLESVGMDPDSFGGRSPFSLSQGEMRRVALAGVLAMSPSFLLLDEPSSGLDAPGREIIYHILENLKAEGKGIFIVTHDWEEVERLADRVFLIAEGRIIAAGEKETVLANTAILRQAGVSAPETVELLGELKNRGLDIPAYCPSPFDAAKCIAEAFKGMRR